MTNYELKNFLVNFFVENQSEWESTAKRIALLFLKTYYDNLDYINQQFDSFLNKKDQTKITSKEYKKLAIIVDIIDLRNMVKIVNKDIEIDYVKIDKTFKTIPKEDKKTYEKVIDEMSVENKKIKSNDLQKQNNQASFRELYLAYNYLISFVKVPDFRKQYYENFLTSESEKIFDYTDLPSSDNSYLGVSTFA